MIIEFHKSLSHLLHSCIICLSWLSGGTYGFSKHRTTSTIEKRLLMDSWASLTYRPTERVQIRCACRPTWRDGAACTDHETAHSQHTGNEILTPGRVGRRCSVHQVDPGWGYLWRYLSVPLGWPPAPPRCAGRVGSHLTAISGSSSTKVALLGAPQKSRRTYLP